MEFKVGNRYKVLQGCSTFTPGSEVELEELSKEGYCHLFRLITGECEFNLSAGLKPGAFIGGTNIEPLESVMSDMNTERSYQTRDELVQENRSLNKQIHSLAKRKEFLAKEVESLGDRIKRKQAFRVGNTEAIKWHRGGA